MKNIFFKSSEKNGIVLHFCKAPTSLLEEASCIHSHTGFCNRSVAICCFEVHGENPSHRWVVIKARSVPAFSANWGYSTLLLHQNSTSDGVFLQSGIWNCISELFYCVTLKSIVCTTFLGFFLSYSFNWSFPYAWFCTIIHWSFGKYWSLLIYYISLYNIFKVIVC